MKLIWILLTLSILSSDPSEIARNNRIKKKASTAFQNGQYDVAAQNYALLYDSLGVDDPAIGLNLAHSYYAMQDTANAKLAYQNVAASDDKKLKSIAYQQLGVMSKKPKSLQESLQYLKAALKADPMNEGARYDYEVVKKMIEEQKKQDQNKDDQNKDDKNKEDQNKDQDQKNKDKQDQQNQDQNKDQQKEDEQSKDQEQQNQDEQKQDKEGEEKKDQQKEGEEEQNEDEQEQQANPDTKQKLEEMNISEEKAKMILEAMRNNEIQYIQQQKRKASKPQDSGKPDW